MKAELYLQKIKNDFPQIKWKKHRVLTHGWDHIIIVLDEKIIFRFPKDKEYKDEFQNEIQLLRYLKKRFRVGIPEYKYISKDKSIAGYDMVRGRELTVSRFRRLSASEKDTVAKQLSGFISALHATPKSVMTKYNVRDENQEKIYKELVSNVKKLLFPRLRKKDIQLIEDYLVELKDALGHKYSNALVHNDLSAEHILWDDKLKQTNIIDFSDRAFGDPAIDFSGLLEYGQKFTEKVLDLYSGKKDSQILKRSQLYFKRVPLSIMIDSMIGYPCTFEQGYTMFKKRFKV
ncbi:aminoglycoside phosphotransferase family protein [Elizabethkingia meningoseptica]|uniref:aminoglycoside O-phosphotransferase APH(2')-G141 n=1 Tax=Bacteroidota TaxID=976 RepID=UPI0016264D38|nr:MULTISPECIES: aminoglycoside O-phosphotransferase APH(2')-G141 [Bacteroidota]MCT4322583.1 aminoglycoside phosphotransferase family protein [Elizabethkingia anophelis]MDE5509945.1 aminoglycoside phosphotransferase family protein [Elizabethkingia meningoseptica]WFB64586.1 aminoglycoside phosphotransferase family protein [Sphingobacterium sp. WM]CAH1150016.1 Bifunctional AAC/APH [Elizabethkingia anophelis]CAI9672407.1 Bifunctional AAC/APH [Elizabethkingia anophelis]